MKCLKCDTDSKVLDTRMLDNKIYRRRACKHCSFRFTTEERIVDDAEDMRRAAYNAQHNTKARGPSRPKKVPAEVQAVIAKIDMPEPPAQPLLPRTKGPTPEQASRGAQLRDLLNRDRERIDDGEIW